MAKNIGYITKKQRKKENSDRKKNLAKVEKEKIELLKSRLTPHELSKLIETNVLKKPFWTRVKIACKMIIKKNYIKDA